MPVPLHTFPHSLLVARPLPSWVSQFYWQKNGEAASITNVVRFGGVIVRSLIAHPPALLCSPTFMPGALAQLTFCGEHLQLPSWP